MLPGASGQIAGASFAIARSTSDAAGSCIELDLDRFGRVLRLMDRLGDHDRDRLPDVAHALRGKHRHRWRETSACRRDR